MVSRYGHAGSRPHRSADPCTRAARAPDALTCTDSAEIRTDRAGVCTVGWWGDDLAARPGPRRPACDAGAAEERARVDLDELAGRSGLARRTLIDLEHGRAAGTVTTWHALAHAFDVPIEQLLGSLCGDHTPPGSEGT